MNQDREGIPMDGMPSSPSARRPAGRLAILHLLLVLLGGFLWCACPAGQGKNVEPDHLPGRATPQDAAEKQAVLVKAAPLVRGPIRAFIEASSDVETLKRVDIYPQLSGLRVVSVEADEGDFVKKDAVMAVLDDEEIKLEVDQAEAAYDEARHRLEKAKVAKKKAEQQRRSAAVKEEKMRKDFENAKKMFQEELISEEEFNADRLAWEQASCDLELAVLQEKDADLDLALSGTEVEKARIALENARLKFSRTRLRAPFDGFVTERSATEGMTVTTTGRLFTLVDGRDLVVHLHIPQEELMRIRVGMPVTFTCDALPGTALTGEVRVINPVVDPESGTVKVRANLGEDTRHLLRPGMFVTARIITDARDDALLVPRKAVIYDEEHPTFFLIGPEMRVRKVRFTPAATTETAMEIAAVVTEGPVPVAGDRVVIVGQDNLKDGDRVQVMEDPP